MNTHRTQSPSPIPRFAAGIVFASLCLAVGLASAAPTPLAPQYAGSFGSGSGSDASFRQISNTWHESTVLWNESTGTYGNGQAISSFGWGSGLWGRADWATIQAMAGNPALVNQWVGQASTISFANGTYNSAHSADWGVSPLVPFLNATDEGHNWTAHFAGFIRITDPGLYNFSVLNDDGFFFRLIGAGGTALDISRDFLNPRERNGFSDNLELSEGLYGFELGMWNRLQAGVVDLRWTRPGGEWELVPTEHLLRTNAVPLPGTLALIGLGLAGLAGMHRRRRTLTA